jgi:hypothetical protein
MSADQRTCNWCLFCWRLEWRIACLFRSPEPVGSRMGILLGKNWVLFEPPNVTKRPQ